MAEFSTHLTIAGRRIGPGEPCLVIAEAGVNHFGDMDKAFALVDMAAEAGADVLKIQHYKTERLVGPSAPDWRERLRGKELTDEQVIAVKEHCDKRGIIFMCTGHDEESLDFLDKAAEVPAFKVGSGEVGNWPSIRAMAARGKPIILSTGMYETEDIRAAIEAVADGGCRELAILHCVTSYPAKPKDVNLAVMARIREFFSGPVGYSDHSAGTAVPLAAVALGADIIEKHITIDKNIPNAQDWKVSCDPSNFASFIRDIREIEAARGGGEKTLAEAENASLQWARKSLTAVRDIQAGEVLAESMLEAQRPGDGLAPFRIGELVGRKALRDIPAGTKLSLDMVNGENG